MSGGHCAQWKKIQADEDILIDNVDREWQEQMKDKSIDNFFKEHTRNVLNKVSNAEAIWLLDTPCAQTLDWVYKATYNSDKPPIREPPIDNNDFEVITSEGVIRPLKPAEKYEVRSAPKLLIRGDSSVVIKWCNGSYIKEKKKQLRKWLNRQFCKENKDK